MMARNSLLSIIWGPMEANCGSPESVSSTNSGAVGCARATKGALPGRSNVWIRLPQPEDRGTNPRSCFPALHGRRRFPRRFRPRGGFAARKFGGDPPMPLGERGHQQQAAGEDRRLPCGGDAHFVKAAGRADHHRLGAPKEQIETFLLHRSVKPADDRDSRIAEACVRRRRREGSRRQGIASKRRTPEVAAGGFSGRRWPRHDPVRCPFSTRLSSAGGRHLQFGNGKVHVLVLPFLRRLPISGRIPVFPKEKPKVCCGNLECRQ